MRIGIAQINPRVGDIAGNLQKIREYIEQARFDQVDLLVFSELALIGYPPRDLLHHRDFLQMAEDALHRLAQETKDVGVLIGSLRREGEQVFNSAFLLDGGNIAWQDKSLLPNYDVFDEVRYFSPALQRRPMDFRGLKLGVHICEDGWNDKDYWPRRRYELDPVEELAAQGVDLLINLSASPYYMDKGRQRRDIVAAMAHKYQKPYLYVNQVGGNDELLFDGRSFLLDGQGRLILEAADFAEDYQSFQWTELTPREAVVPRPEGVAALEKALVMGIRDYFAKTGFQRAVLGLSGGIDSAVTAALAVKALGKEQVLGVAMPSPYSSQGSVDDAQALAENLGIEFRLISITPMFESFVQTLSAGEKQMDLTEENIQARLRGNLLMALSNREGRLLLTTGNKSEMAVGYCTLYGDMSGGLAVISDVPKTLVYQLARYLNRDGEAIPQNTIDKPPSAELRPDQKDSDSLPDYEVLDGILQGAIEERLSLDELTAQGYEWETVSRVLRMMQINEYKRRQAAPGLKVTSKAFGMGRRYPIAQGWTWHQGNQ